MEEIRGTVDAARHRQEKREAARLGNLLSHTEASSSIFFWGGGGGALPNFIFCSLFPVQQTTSGIGHRVE